MRYHNITKDDMLNGEGLRVTLWVAGCEHHCKGCQNPCTWDPNSGLLFDEDAKAELFEQLDKSYISGITFCGGDPLATYNRKEVIALAKEIKGLYPNKNIWCYTGYTLPELETDPNMNEFFDLCDVLIDGRFVEELLEATYHWAGSCNQHVYRIDHTKKGTSEWIVSDGKTWEEANTPQGRFMVCTDKDCYGNYSPNRYVGTCASCCS